MSLDVTLFVKDPIIKRGTGVFVRDQGKTRELTPDEVLDRFPEAKEVTLRQYEDHEAYSANITHNLNKMAQAADLYDVLWRPDQMKNVKYAKDIVVKLANGLQMLESDPEYFKRYDPENGWGNYDNLIDFVKNYLKACQKYPNAEIGVSR